MNNIFEARGLAKRFGGFAAVDGVDLSIQAGEIRCIIGPNGAGKSTFLRLAVGVYTPSAGAVYFDDEDVSNVPSFRRIAKGIGIKFQIPGVFPALDTSENLAVALQRCIPSRELDGEVDRLLDLLGLELQRDTMALNLSHGQQQWLDIGMAMSARPRLLLLDEPTAGMTPEETFKTGELVQRLNAQGTTVVAIEHDMDFVRQIARKVTVLHYGRVFCEGSIAEVENNEDVVRIYLGST